jgi:hypothetical protein
VGIEVAPLIVYAYTLGALLRRYEIINLAGEGVFGILFRSYHPTNTLTNKNAQAIVIGPGPIGNPIANSTMIDSGTGLEEEIPAISQNVYLYTDFDRVSMVRDYQSQSASKFTCTLILIVPPWCVIIKANQPESLPVH